MANFSVNQNRQFYVVTAADTVDSSAAVGTAEAVFNDDKLNPEAYIKVVGADGVLRSDRIPLKNVNYLKKVTAAEMIHVFKKVTVTLDSAYLVSSKPIPGQDYILRIVFSQFYGPSDAHTYVKEGCVHVTSGMTTTQFYAKMVDSLNMNFAREIGATKTTNPYLTFSSSSSGIVITEKEQDWKLGTMKQRPLVFEVQPATIYVDGIDVVWGAVADSTPAKADAVVGTDASGNGKQIADLEWFCMGERGDQYRGVGYPNYIPTTYLVDPTKEYDVLEIHYAFTDTGVNSYRSEKDITLVCEKPASGTSPLDTILAAFESELGIEEESSSN